MVISAEREGKDIDEQLEKIRGGMPFLDKWLKCVQAR